MMALSLEHRAARLVAALNNQGVQVASLVIADGEIRVTFGEPPPPAVHPCDLIDFGPDPKVKAKTKAR